MFALPTQPCLHCPHNHVCIADSTMQSWPSNLYHKFGFQRQTGWEYMIVQYFIPMGHMGDNPNDQLFDEIFLVVVIFYFGKIVWWNNPLFYLFELQVLSNECWRLLYRFPCWLWWHISMVSPAAWGKGIAIIDSKDLI